MRAKFLALMALVLGMVSCQNDFDGANVGNQGEVDFTLNVAVPELTTRAAGSSSAASGLDNIDLDSDYDVRYLLEVYDANGALAKERFTNYEDKAATTSFNLRLIPGRKYTFVVWADFVLQQAREEGKNYDLHYVTTNADGLKNVTVKDASWGVIDESRDAYTGKHTEEEFKSSSSITVNLTRPFAKLRVVTTDIKELGPLMPKTATVNYTSKLYTSFNAYTATAGDLTAITDAKVVDFATDTYGDEANPKAATSKGEMTLFADYFFGAEDDKVLFTMDVVDSSDQTIPTIVFNTNIPVQRNYLTTVKGPILTDSNNITVTIDDVFDNVGDGTGTDWNPEEDDFDVDLWNGTSMSAPVDSDNDGVYEIGTGAQLAYLAAAVNGTLPSTASTRAEVVNWAKEEYVLTQSLNLGGNEWTPIGGPNSYFAGTFDGQENSIVNFQITKQDGYAALFGNSRGTIKNLTVENVTIVAHHYAGAIVGQGYTRIEGCHVDNVDITLTTKNGDLGDKAGGIIGQNCEGAGMHVKNSTAKNVTIKGYRDLGGIIGMAHNKNTVSGCNVENITILQDLSVNYEKQTPTTLGAVIGRKGTNVIDTNNTIGEGIKIAVMVANREQLQAALNAAKAGETLICLCADIEGNVTIEQKPDVKVTVDGCDYNYVGEITVDGKSQAYATAAFTVKNVNFTLATGDVAINLGVSGNSNTRYASNVTVENCTFTGTDKTAAAIKTYTGGGKNLTVANCKATGLHSLTQLHNIEGVAISGCEVVGGKNGIALGHSQDVTISETEVACVGYGVRADGTKENVVSLTITDCNFDAYIPVTVREMTEDACVFKLTLTGNNTLTKGGDYHIAVCSNEYEEGKTPVAPKGTIELNGTAGLSVYTKIVAVAKVGDTEYVNIDEAIEKWVNGSNTLTLLANVTLSDVVKIKSTEHHILNLGTYTLTASEGKNAFEIIACGTGDAEQYAITINADGTNPGGINAGSKAIVYYDYSKGTAAGANDRPIIKINGGVFNASTASLIWGTTVAGIHFKGGSAARQAATLNITGGEFNCSIYGSGKSKMLISGGLFHYYVSSQGDSTAYRLISGGTFKTLGFMTADSNNTKFWIGTSIPVSDVGVYINDENYLVVGGPVITGFDDRFEIKIVATKWSTYLQYSSAAANGLYCTNAAILTNDQKKDAVYNDNNL